MTKKPPIQPLVIDEAGNPRFLQNRIVRDLLDFATEHGFGLNETARGDYTREEHQQLAQLIGYSFRGYGELSYVDDDAYNAAAAMVDGMTEEQARIQSLQATLDGLRKQLQEPMATLFGVHPLDLSRNLPEEPK